MTQQAYKHWKIDTDKQFICWLTFDRDGEKVNSLSREVFAELDQIVDQIKQDNPAGVIIQSGKKTGFIAGADINQFLDLKTEDEAFDLIRQAQLVLDKIEALPMPTVAMIKGFSMGGGTELALACDYRVADDAPSTRIGLPEIKLGIHPGWGGTVRLPRIVGAVEAMKMILPGAAYPSKKCAKIGIIDAAVPERNLKRAAVYYIENKPAKQKPKTWLGKCSNMSMFRSMFAKMFYKGLADKHVNREHYPAPYAVVKQWKKDGAKGERAMINEAKSIAKLMLTPTARNLVRVFFLQTRLKSLGKKAKFSPQHVHVIGAGTMGGDIAAWCAFKGMRVTLQDQTPEQIAPAMKRAYQLFKKKLRQPRLIQAAMDRLQPDIHGRGVASADVVIEAIFENLEAKQALFKELETKLKPEAVLATNTSSIPLEAIATVLKDPTRLVGIHFFNPVAKMPLVEIVSGAKTAKTVADRSATFVGKLSRLPLPVASRPGFLVNRILMPYLLEAMALYDEGIPKESIDKAALKFGMPMGPITLADKVGLDICYSVAKNLTQQFGGEVPKTLEKMIQEERFGVKNNRGFYDYKNGRKVKSDKPAANKVNTSEITDRLILRMVNESVACLQEGVVEDRDLLDAGMIFGTGFAPFRGGPMNYAKTRGEKAVVEQLQVFAEKFGERFQPVTGWEKFVVADEQPSAAKTKAKPKKTTAKAKVKKLDGEEKAASIQVNNVDKLTRSTSKSDEKAN